MRGTNRSGRPAAAAALAAVLAWALPGAAVGDLPDERPPQEPPAEEDLFPPGELGQRPDARPGLADQIRPSPLVDRLIDDELTEQAERRRLKLFHGRWDALDESALDPAERAELALGRFELDTAVFEDEGVPASIRAEAALERGEAEAALAIIDEADDLRQAWLLAEAYRALGRLDEAADVLSDWLDQDEEAWRLSPAAARTYQARAIARLAELQGRPARDYQRAMDLLGAAHQRHDSLYWPALLAEAELLLSRDNRPEGIAALMEALSLNPSAGRAWYHLARLMARGFNFEPAEEAIERLRAINEEHVLADAAEAHLRLVQRDGSGAAEVAAEALGRYPQHRELHALKAAGHMLAYDEQAAADALEAFDALAPGSPQAHLISGIYLSLARQYDEAERMLREAIERQPHSAQARVELGLLLMQAGQDETARDELREATRLDPFNRRASNQLRLVEALLDEYGRIETDHFIITYEPGIDEALARDVERYIETVYDEITQAYEFEPDRKTQIDILADEEWFGVRITGMPEIWTVGAATGPIIAITPPREGGRQRGTFDWANVLRHEFVHTVNLAQTNNRVPHWFTEACAVYEELVDRSYENARLLAWALHEDELFAFDEINWGFVRPRTPRDRPLAYAQAHWMLEYIVERFGRASVVQMLGLHRQGRSDVEALREVTGVDHETFFSDFREWAHNQVVEWGMQPLPEDEALEALLGGESLDEAKRREVLDRYGDHPEVLRYRAARAMEDEDAEAAREAVRAYARARPVDPWAQRQLARLALQEGRTDEAVAALEELDARQLDHGRWAHQLAQIHRRTGELERAAQRIERALHREAYNATYRELAAAIALQRGDMDEALHHVRALTLLEPDRVAHFVRLAAVHARMGEADRAAEAAAAARELDAQAPVQRFLDE